MSDYQLLSIFIGGLGLVIPAVFFGARFILGRFQSYLDNRMEAMEARAKRRDESIEEMERRVSRAENRLDNVPSHRDLQEISTRIEQVHGEVSKIGGSLEGIGRAVDIMNQHLMERGE